MTYSESKLSNACWKYNSGNTHNTWSLPEWNTPLLLCQKKTSVIHLEAFHFGLTFLSSEHTLLICRRQNFLPHKRIFQQQLLTPLLCFSVSLTEDLVDIHWMAPGHLRKFSLYHPSCFSFCLACWFSRQPVIQASAHQRSVLWKPAARIRSSKSLGYLFMTANGSLAERLSLIPIQNNFQGFAHPGQCWCLDCVGPLVSSVLRGVHHPALMSHQGTLQNVFYTTSHCFTNIMKK